MVARPRETALETAARCRTSETAADGFQARPSAADASKDTGRRRPHARESNECSDNPAGLRCRSGWRRPASYRRHIRYRRAIAADRDHPEDRAEWSDE